MESRYESQSQIDNQGSVQGQNIAQQQQITQYFHGTDKGNETLQDYPSRLIFAGIMLDKGNLYWYEIDDLTSEEAGKPFPLNITNALIPDPYHRLYSQHFHATTLPPDPDRVQVQLSQLSEEERGAMEYLNAMGIIKEKANPSFDVTLFNPTRQPIILTKIGIEMTSVALIFSLPGGGPRAYTVPVDASYTIDIPDIGENLNIMKRMQRVGSSYHHVPPVQLNKVFSTWLPDPICIPPRATFRYTLLLARYLEHIPNSTLLHLWIETHGGPEQSHGLYLSFGDIWWEKDAIKELGESEKLEE